MNPYWQKGCESPNPQGRKVKNRHSVRTVKGMVERFVKKNITPNKLQKMFDALKSDKEKLDMLLELLPYCIAKQTPLQLDKLSDDDLNQLYEQVMANFKNNSVINGI